MDAGLERLLASQCAPTLAGLKAASIVGSAPERRQQVAREVWRYNLAFQKRHLRFRLIPTRRRRDLLLVYRPDLLARTLTQPGAEQLLREQGYPADADQKTLLNCLCRRLATQQEFPHEVGLFLGYPLEDVVGFVEHQGREWKSLGLWKVYSDVDRAQTLFERYEKCRAAVCRQVDQGASLCRLFGGQELPQ